MQVGDLRLPLEAQHKSVPLVIIIHGGCWVSSYADYHFMDNFSEAITQLGYATWNIEYRGIGTGGDWPVIFRDIGKAVDYSRVIAKNYPVDIQRVAVIGHSAGGHLALWAASRNSVKGNSQVYTYEPLGLRGALSLAGIADVTSINSCSAIASRIIGESIDSNDLTRLQETSPYHMLPITTKTVLISGDYDGIVPPAIGSAYTKKANENGNNSEHYILQATGHFDLINPDKTNWALYQQTLEEFFRD